MDYSSKLTQLLQQLEVETGITFTVADSTLDEAETLAKVRDFLSFYQTRDNRNLFLSRFFLGQLSPEEILRGKQRFHIEESTLRVLFLLECKQPYDPAVISVLSNLNASGADMIVELDSLHIAVIRQLKHSLSDQALRKAALGLVDTLEAETMVSFAVRLRFLLRSVFTASCQLSELPCRPAHRKHFLLLRAGLRLSGTWARQASLLCPPGSLLPLSGR